jgi:hypothetical protein
MSPTKPNPIVRILPSLTDLAFLMPIVFLFVRLTGAQFLLGDGDTGWHIRTGEWIMANGRVPEHDVFSFTKAGQTWYAWEWLSDVLFAWLYHHGGLAIVVVFGIFLISLTMALLFRLVLRHCNNPLIAIGCTCLACAASTIHWLARPHLFTMFFVVILLAVLDRAREGRTRLLLVLPPMMVLWTNLHGGFFVGLVVIGAYAAGEVALVLFSPDQEERSQAIRLAEWYVLTALGCAAATFLNPYTYHLHSHIIQFFSEPYHFQNINEYQSINFHGGAAPYLEGMLFLGVISAVWLLRHRNFTPLILAVGWGHLALFSARNIPLFAIIAAPIAAQGLDEMLSSLHEIKTAAWIQRLVSWLKDAASDFGETDRLWRLHLTSAFAIVVLALLITSPNATGKLKPEYDPARYPSKALAVLRANPEARVFADDEWGDYLIYNLSPGGHKVFVDGRDDFYGQKFEEKYMGFMNVKYDWEQYLRQYRIDTVLLSTTSPLATVIKESRHWRTVYDDSVAIVFTAVPNQASESQSASMAVPSGNQRDRRVTSAVRRDPRVAVKKLSTKRSITT